MQIIKFATTLCAATAALMPAVAGMRSREHAHATNSLAVHGEAPPVLDSASDSRLFQPVTRVFPRLRQGNPAQRASVGRAKMQERPARAHFQELNPRATVSGTGNSNAAAQQRVPLALEKLIAQRAEIVTPEKLIAQKAALRVQEQNPPTSGFQPRKAVRPQRSADNLPAVEEDYGAVAVTGKKKWMRMLGRHQGGQEKRKVAPASQDELLLAQKEALAAVERMSKTGTTCL